MKTPKPKFPLFIAFAMTLAVASDAHATELKPSRLIDLNDVEHEIAAIEERLAIGKRQFDPFGKYQDPQRRTPVLPQVGPGKDRIQRRGLPFDQVVDQIPVAAVEPKGQCVMIAGRFFSVGQEFPVRFKGAVVGVEVVRVTPAEVDFRNVKTGEFSTYTFNKAPDLMRKDQPKDFAPDPVIDLN